MPSSDAIDRRIVKARKKQQKSPSGESRPDGTVLKAVRVNTGSSAQPKIHTKVVSLPSQAAARAQTARTNRAASAKKHGMVGPGGGHDQPKRAVVRAKVHTEQLAQRKRDDAEIAAVGEARSQGARHAAAELLTAKHDAPFTMHEAKVAGREAEFAKHVTDSRRQGGAIPEHSAALAGEAHKSAELVRAEHPEKRRHWYQNAYHEVLDAAGHAPSAMMALGNIPKDVSKEVAAAGLKVSDKAFGTHTKLKQQPAPIAGTVKALRTGAIGQAAGAAELAAEGKSKQARKEWRDAKDVLHARPVETVLSVAGGVGTAAKAASIAGRAARATKAAGVARTTSKAGRAGLAADVRKATTAARKRAPLQVVDGARVVASKRRTYSANPLFSGAQHVAEKAQKVVGKDPNVAGKRKAGRMVKRKAKHDTAITQSAGHSASAQVASRTSSVNREVRGAGRRAAKLEKAVTARHGVVAVHEAARGHIDPIARQKRLQATRDHLAAAKQHVRNMPDKVVRLDSETDAQFAHAERVLERQRAHAHENVRSTQLLLDELIHLHAKGDVFDDPQLAAVGRNAQRISRNQDVSQTYHRELDPTRAENRLKLQHATESGGATYNFGTRLVPTKVKGTLKPQPHKVTIRSPQSMRGTKGTAAKAAEPAVVAKAGSPGKAAVAGTDHEVAAAKAVARATATKVVEGRVATRVRQATKALSGEAPVVVKTPKVKGKLNERETLEVQLAHEAVAAAKPARKASAEKRLAQVTREQQAKADARAAKKQKAKATGRGYVAPSLVHDGALDPAGDVVATRTGSPRADEFQSAEEAVHAHERAVQEATAARLDGLRQRGGVVTAHDVSRVLREERARAVDATHTEIVKATTPTRRAVVTQAPKKLSSTQWAIAERKAATTLEKAKTLEKAVRTHDDTIRKVREYLRGKAGDPLGRTDRELHAELGRLRIARADHRIRADEALKLSTEQKQHALAQRASDQVKGRGHGAAEYKATYEQALVDEQAAERAMAASHRRGNAAHVERDSHLLATARRRTDEAGARWDDAKRDVGYGAVPASNRVEAVKGSRPGLVGASARTAETQLAKARRMDKLIAVHEGPDGTKGVAPVAPEAPVAARAGRPSVAAAPARKATGRRTTTGPVQTVSPRPAKTTNVMQPDGWVGPDGKKLTATNLPHTEAAYYRPSKTGAPELVMRHDSGLRDVADARYAGNQAFDAPTESIGEFQTALQGKINSAALQNVLTRGDHVIELKLPDRPKGFSSEEARGLWEQKRRRLAEAEATMVSDRSGIPHVAQRVTDGRGYIVLPKAHAKQLVAVNRELGKIGKAVDWGNRKFVRAVLPLSPAWHVGNVTDLMMRIALTGGRPGDKALQETIAAVARQHEGQEWARLVFDSVGGAHYKAQGEMYAKTKPLVNVEGLAPISAGLDHLLGVGRGLEAHLVKSAQGTVLRGLSKELGLKTSEHLKLAEAMKHDPGLVEDFQRRTLDIVGDYLHHPGVIAGVDLRVISPFVQWIKASTKFVMKTLPVHHPIRASLLLLAASSTEEQRRKLGLSNYITAKEAKALELPKPRTGFLAGGADNGDGSVTPLSPFTSFGAVASMLEDPLTTAKNVLPWLNKPLGSVAGSKRDLLQMGERKAEKALGGRSDQWLSRGHALGPNAIDATRDASGALIPVLNAYLRGAREGLVPPMHAALHHPGVDASGTPEGRVANELQVNDPKKFLKGLLLPTQPAVEFKGDPVPLSHGVLPNGDVVVEQAVSTAKSKRSNGTNVVTITRRGVSSEPLVKPRPRKAKVKRASGK